MYATNNKFAQHGKSQSMLYYIKKQFKNKLKYKITEIMMSHTTTGDIATMSSNNNKEEFATEEDQ
jgi:hypothetical protein